MQKIIRLIPILADEWLNIVPTLWRWAAPLFNRPQGMYEVLDHDVRLELLDSRGHDAIYFKQQSVKFLQDNIIAYQDEAWGHGDIFADYQCSPGVEVDRYLEGTLYNILISLRETKNRGDMQEFFIKRRIRNGFTRKREYFQNRVNHAMRHFSISVVFPPDRAPKHIVLIEHTIDRTTPLGSANIRLLPDGCQKVVWETNRPRLHEMYSIRWDW